MKYRKVGVGVEVIDKDGWLDVSGDLFNFEEDVEESIVGDYLWADGSMKMWDLKNNRLSVPVSAEVDQVEVERVEAVERANTFNAKREVEIKAQEHKVFMASLPKFSSAMLARMKAAEEAASSTRASKQFYTWEKGNSASVTSHTAWGHRRSGGGKGKVQSLQEMNSDKVAAIAAAAKRIRQQVNKIKGDIEASNRAVTMVRLNAQKAALDACKLVVETDVEVETEEIVEAVVSVETEWQKFKREELISFNAKVVDTDLGDRYMPKVVAREVTVAEPKWQVVDAKKVKREKEAKMLTISIYKEPVETIVAMAVEKVSWKKSRPASLMCRSVVKGDKCPHPVGKCNFAHCVEDLNPKNCVNRCCRFVKKIGDKFVNKGSKVCTFLHEGEVKSNLCRRIGLKFVDVVVKVAIVDKKLRWVTPMSERVLRPYSIDVAWGPIV
jgi:hypothetical protein